jgi:transcriptional regulator with XRE-family HTH domain
MIDKYKKHYSILGELIRNLRTQKAYLNQAQFAQKLGVKQSYVSKIENGKVRIGIIEVWEICSIMDIPFTEFAKMLESTLLANPSIKRNR